MKPMTYIIFLTFSLIGQVYASERCYLNRSASDGKVVGETCFFSDLPKEAGAKVFVIHNDFIKNETFEFYAELKAFKSDSLPSTCSDIYFLDEYEFISDTEIPEISFGYYPPRYSCENGLSVRMKKR
jgi:hypothetical protein